MSGTLVLAPPYGTMRRYSHNSVRVGAILVCDLRGGITALADAVLAHRAAPWSPICLLYYGKPLDPRVCEAFEPQPSTFAELNVDPNDREAGPDAVVAAVRRRRAPSPADLARYVTARIQHVEFAVTLQTCFESGSGLTSKQERAPRSTFRRHLERFYPLTARDWAALGHLVFMLLDAGNRQVRSYRRLAREHRLDPRTLRGRLVRFLGGSLADAITRPGWEWVLETSLRKWNYLDTHGRTAARSQAQLHVSGAWPDVAL